MRLDRPRGPGDTRWRLARDHTWERLPRASHTAPPTALRSGPRCSPVQNAETGAPDFAWSRTWMGRCPSRKTWHLETVDVPLFGTKVFMGLTLLSI